jgi:hypothetical protein
MKKIIVFLCLFGFFNSSFAQGCSDAGICSVGHAFQAQEKTLKNQIEVAPIFGIGETYITYFSPSVTYTRILSDKLALSTKVTFSSATGDFGTRAAFGDGYLIGNYTFKEKNNKQWSALMGWKFPFTSANLKINGYSLPMDYQASLGTFDLFLGTNFRYKKFDFNTAVQIPVFNINRNSYVKEFSGTDEFLTTNLFERQPDALFRTTYTWQTKTQKFTFKPNLLFIYHLGEDSFENIFGQRQTIEGSDGLTINGNLVSIYHLNKKNSIELSVASPFVVREVRPDGLTRGFVASVHYKIAF